jgi:hypothetical protein
VISARRARPPAELADAAYEAVRALNHATVPAQCELANHLDLYRVLGSLAALLHATPQALRQTADWLTREQQAGRVNVDATCPASPATTVRAIITALAAAADTLTHSARRVDHANEATAHVITEPTHQIGM